MILRAAAYVIAFVAFLAASLSSASAERRIALVIGNSAYGEVSNLVNPANDAADIASALEGIGFGVRRETDLGFDAMRRALRAFSEDASRADVALIFYAGHGIEVDKQNYVIPVDARLKRDDDIDYEAIPLDLLMRSVDGARSLKLVLLDACRNNPFAASMKTGSRKRSIGRGFARVEPTVGTLVGFAAKEGTTADDGDGRNSPYTAALIKHLKEPGLEINFLFRKVRDTVIASTNGQQEPFTYGSLPGRQIYLTAGPRSDAPAEPASSPTGMRALSEIAQVWASTRDTTSIALLEAFIANYPDTVFARLASARVQELRNQPGPRQEVASVARQGGQRFPDEKSLVTALQKELNRHRCNAGTADGAWGRKSRSAVAKFAKYAKLDLSPEPTEELLDHIKARTGMICPLSCSPRYQIKDEKCVLKTCPAGQLLSDRGTCTKVVAKRPCSEWNWRDDCGAYIKNGVCHYPKNGGVYCGCPPGSGAFKHCPLKFVEF